MWETNERPNAERAAYWRWRRRRVDGKAVNAPPIRRNNLHIQGRHAAAFDVSRCSRAGEKKKDSC
ncbi:hypothetical protein NECAME_00072 [Necator americanus]|uniref:Uncharacterized protein n=1 Tax=Necator americanus TaxID=51031 RepID=W2TZD5_NECAM|nr:hypothetical protein NECAME_00072 [Necator americanus]ETN87213.1 hypothetical protein NECAME_00072 [Necator americanus]